MIHLSTAPARADLRLRSQPTRIGIQQNPPGSECCVKRQRCRTRSVHLAGGPPVTSVPTATGGGLAFGAARGCAGGHGGSLAVGRICYPLPWCYIMKLPRRFLHLAAGAIALPTVSRFAWAQLPPTGPGGAVRVATGLQATWQSTAWLGAEAGLFKKRGIDMTLPAIAVGGPK
jgi:hypothetical protein